MASSRMPSEFLPSAWEPVFVGPDLGHIHGLNEYVGVKSLLEGREFLYRPGQDLRGREIVNTCSTAGIPIDGTRTLDRHGHRLGRHHRPARRVSSRHCAPQASRGGGFARGLGAAVTRVTGRPHLCLQFLFFAR